MIPAQLFTAGTHRGRQNYLYVIEALTALDCLSKPDAGPTPFPLLVDWEAAEARKRGAVKYGVLTELGRASRELHPDVVRLMAERVSEALEDGRITTVREAEAQVRRWREMMREAKQPAT